MSTAVTVMGILLAAALPGDCRASLATCWATATDEDRIEGKATYFVAGLMDEVAINRGMDLDGYLSGVALNRAGDLGRAVWLEWADGAGGGAPVVDGPFLVVDCAQRGEHFEIRERQGYVVEVPAWVARLRNFYGIGPTDVVVWFMAPAGNSNPSEKRWF